MKDLTVNAVKQFIQANKLCEIEVASVLDKDINKSLRAVVSPFDGFKYHETKFRLYNQKKLVKEYSGTELEQAVKAFNEIV